MATNQVIKGENLSVLKSLPDESFQLIYIDPPFNTGRKQVGVDSDLESGFCRGFGSVRLVFVVGRIDVR